MGNLGSFVQILVFVLVIAGPAIGAIARKLKAHAEAKRAEVERNKRRIEAIRTGRLDATDPSAGETRTPTEDQSRRARLEQLARQRQAQIEELRRRAAQRRAQAGGQSGGQPTGQPAGPQRSQPQHSQPRPDGSQKRPTVQARSAAQSSGGRSQMPRSTPVPQQSASREAIEARRRAEIARRRTEIQALKEQAARQAAAAQRAAAQRTGAAKASPAKPARSALRVSAEPEPVARVHKPMLAAQPIAQTLRDPAGLRNAIVLTEILGPPVGLRRPGTGPGDDPASI